MATCWLVKVRTHGPFESVGLGINQKSRKGNSQHHTSCMVTLRTASGKWTRPLPRLPPWALATWEQSPGTYDSLGSATRAYAAPRCAFFSSYLLVLPVLSLGTTWKAPQFGQRRCDSIAAQCPLPQIHRPFRLALSVLRHVSHLDIRVGLGAAAEQPRGAGHTHEHLEVHYEVATQARL